MVNRKIEQKEICERLRDLIAWRKRVDGISQNDFALLIGSKLTTFLDYLKPKGQSKIRLELLNSIVRSFPQVNREWLFWGEGEMLMAEEKCHASGQTLDTQAATISDALLEKLLARNEELQDKILKLTYENATLKTRMEFLASEGGQTQVPGTTRPPGEDTAE